VREIKLHHFNPENPETDIRVYAVGKPDAAGDWHRYRIDGFATNDHPDEGEGSGHYVADIFFHCGNPEEGWKGLTLESLLAVCADRLDNIQLGPYNCPENEAALLSIYRAIRFLHSRSKRVIVEETERNELRSTQEGMDAAKVAGELVERGLDTSKRVYEPPMSYEALVAERTQEPSKLFDSAGQEIERPTGPLTEADQANAEFVHQKVIDAVVDELLNSEEVVAAKAATQARLAELTALDAQQQAAQADQAVMDALETTMGVGDTERRRLIPAVTDLSKNHFLLEESVTPISWDMGMEESVITLPLKTNIMHDLMALCNASNLLVKGLVGEDDTMARDLRLEGFYIEFAKQMDDGSVLTEVVPFGVLDDNVTYGAINIAPDSPGMSMVFISDDLPINCNTHLANDQPSQILRAVFGDELEASFKVSIAGSVNLATTTVIFSGSPLELFGDVRTLGTHMPAALTEEKKKEIAHLLNAARVVAVDLIAYRESAPDAVAA
jgi:hypothetical protein